MTVQKVISWRFFCTTFPHICICFLAVLHMSATEQANFCIEASLAIYHLSKVSIFFIKRPKRSNSKMQLTTFILIIKDVSPKFLAESTKKMSIFADEAVFQWLYKKWPSRPLLYCLLFSLIERPMGKAKSLYWCVAICKGTDWLFSHVRP